MCLNTSQVCGRTVPWRREVEIQVREREEIGQLLQSAP